MVYNHLGPEGNYLGESGPYLSSKHATVSGARRISTTRFTVPNCEGCLSPTQFIGMRNITLMGCESMRFTASR